MNTKLGLTAVYAALCAACSAPDDARAVLPAFECGQSEGVTVADAHTLLLCGKISNEAHTALQSIDFEPNDYSQLVIKSAGGSIPAAMDIARIVSKRDLRIVVDELCLSACASFILPAAKSVAVKENSVIALHQSDYAVYEILSLNQFNQNDPTEMGIMSGRTQGEHFLRTYALSEDWFLEPMRRIRVLCFDGFMRSKKHNAVFGVKIHRAHNYWVPEKAWLAEYITLEPSEAWNENHRQALSVFRRTIEDQYPASYLTFGSEHELPADALLIPRCSNSEVD